MKKLIAIICLSLSVVAVKAQTATTNVVQNFSAVRFKAIIENDKQGEIIDLRTPEEVAKGYINGAVFIDWLAKDAEKQIEKLDKSKTYYIYCASGGRSGEAAEFMEKKGFKRVCVLEKGISDWTAKGYPVVTK